VFVAEQDVDPLGDQPAEVVAVPLDAEGVAERERHLAAVLVRHAGGHPERLLGVRAIEQVALHVQDLAVGDRRRVDVVGMQQRRHAEVGVHRPLGIGRHDDDAPARGHLLGGGAGARAERDADSAQVVTEHVAEVVVGDLADVRRLAAEAGDAGHRVGRRAATHLDRRPERLVQADGALGLDERHRTLDQFLRGEEVVIGLGDDVDEGVADADDVVAGAMARG
jgi:hypothetical protein